MKTPFTRVSVAPGYALGFAYAWEISGGFADTSPWVFVVEQAPSPGGPWVALSPETTNYAWSEDRPRRVSKNTVLFFRVRMTTPGGQYVSETVTPYGELDRREYLIARDIMRKELLYARTLAGTPGRLWSVSACGPRCSVCLDPITGVVRSSACRGCFGVGRSPPYHGPYEVWFTFNTATRTTRMAEDGSGTHEPREFEVRVIGSLPTKKNDFIVDTRTDKRYYIDGAQSVAELRRVPLVQTLFVREAPVSESIYKVK